MIAKLVYGLKAAEFTIITHIYRLTDARAEYLRPLYGTFQYKAQLGDGPVTQ